MATRMKFLARYQIFENNKIVTDPQDLSYDISNAIDMNNGTRFSLDPGESVEITLDNQANCLIVSSDDPVTIVTDDNTLSGVSNFTVDSATDVATSTKDVYPYTSQKVTLTTSGTLPDPLVVGTEYYVISRDKNQLLFATSDVNAKAGTNIDLTDTGTGVHTLDLDDSYAQNIDSVGQSVLNIITGTNVKRFTIKNNGSATTSGKYYTARTAS